ncbi:MAG: flagellar basal-body rod protein FlgF [Chromatiales bacterium]|nr:flagellar basal-body rod protein FlgF [Chromatiales bacterium]
MDRMLYLAMSTAKQTLHAQAANSNNLANVSTTGFRADLEQFRSMPVFGEGMPSRVYAMNERHAIDFTQGPINATGREFDLAIRGEGWIAVQAPDGAEAYTRAGDLHMDDTGLLTTGAGHPVLGNNGVPIIIPPAEHIVIGVDGTISIRPIGQEANALAEIDRIKLVNPDPAALTKGEDGLIRLFDGGDSPPDANVEVLAGSLEGSNVSVVGAMVKMIELQRQYELQIKMMTTAKENDQAADQILRIS